MDTLIHVNVGNKLKKRMEFLLDSGLFTSEVEIVREGLRDLLAKYSSNLESSKK